MTIEIPVAGEYSVRVRSYGQYCAVAKALDAVGDRWTLLIVRELMLRDGCRYTDLVHGLPGIATNLLTDRLRELEDAGLVAREAAPPPVATTLYRLTDAGRELNDVLIALGRWGTRFMADPNGDEVFRAHWLAFPASQFLHDHEPDGPPVSIEIKTGEEAAVIETVDGNVRTRTGTATSPDLVLSGAAPLILALLSGRLTLAQARSRGLKTSGATDALKRLQGVAGADASSS
jgi:DNA-binding HxlR family transcriptional regulator